MKSHLKVKIKSLAAEARIIRLEEQRIIGWKARRITPSAEEIGPKVRAGGRLNLLRSIQAPAPLQDAAFSEYHSLRMHRINEVRSEARASLLAYGFLRARPRIRIEAQTPPPWVVKKALSLAERFGSERNIGEAFDEWLKAA